MLCGSVYFAIQLGRLICNGIYTLFGIPAVAIMAVTIVVVYVIAVAAITWGVGNRAPRLAVNATDSHAPDVAAIVPVSEEQVRANPLYRSRYGLTDREIDIAVLALAGYNASEMSQMLGLSVNTVKTHLKNLYSKMGVHNRRELGEVFGAVERGD
jgi:DNA-binding CsgD family transcriptional regulator